MSIKESKKIKCFQKVILISNINFLLINIFLGFIFEKFQNIIYFKYSDSFIIKLNQKTFQVVSDYLNNEYEIKSSETKNNRKIQKIYLLKKVLKISVTGMFNREKHLNWLKSKLDDEFSLDIDELNPDYLIYNVFNNKYMEPKYQSAIKIAIYTENIMPDLNLADYAIGHYHINYLDRFFKYSVFLWRNFTNIEKKRDEILRHPIRRKFCAALISNCNAKFRLNFISKLSKYKKIDVLGKCGNNNNKAVINKIEFLSDYKFSIAMENSNGDGYLTEKIVDSFIAGTIPIYFGDYMLEEFINPKTYILINQ